MEELRRVDTDFGDAMRGSWQSLSLGAVLIVLLTVVAYVPAMRGGFIWDDDDYVTQNLTLRSAGGLSEIWLNPHKTAQYYPLTFTVFWIEYHLWGLQPFGYHFVNVLLHALNAVLLWRVLRRLEIQGAWWAAAVFALHPVQVESVAWVTERKNVLSGMFYLLAMLAWFHFRPLTAGQTAGSRDWRVYPLVMLLFLCALLSKTVTCSLPAAIVLLTWWKRGRIEKRDSLALVPLFVLGAALGLMTAWMEKHRVGASGAEWALSFMDRCLVAGRALWFYAGKLFWPHKLAFIYSRWEIDARAAWQYLFPLAALAVLIALWLLRRRIGKGPLVAVSFFAGTLVPALGFFDVYPFRYSFVANHFQYLASIGLIALAVATAATISKRARRAGRHIGMVAGIVTLMVLGALTCGQGRIFRDAETLWRDTLAKNPDVSMAHINLGGVLAHQGRLAEAVAEYMVALRIHPDDAEAHNDLGLVLARQGKTAEAIDEYQTALRIQPNLAVTHNNLGVVLAGQGKTAEAIDEYQTALRIQPNLALAHNNLGLVLAGQGKTAEAIAEYRAALRVKPDLAEAHYNLGVVLAGLGKTAEAVAAYQAALRIRPDNAAAHNNLGNILARQGKLAEAAVEYQAALRIKPDLVEARFNLGRALAGLGKTAEAAAEYQAVLRISPDNVEAHYNVGNALAGQGRIAEATAEYRETLRLTPDWPPALSKLAWILATDRNANFRNAGEAVQLAERLCAVTGYQQADALDVLAAAYAEAGRFSDALRVAQQAVELASAAGRQELARQLQERLQLYQAGRPFHEVSPPPS